MADSEYKFAEVKFDPEIVERFSAEMSPYHQDQLTRETREHFASYRRKLMWHIRNSLSKRQRQTLVLVLSGKTEREVATILGITQQVVHNYKWRAIKRLQEKLNA